MSASSTGPDRPAEQGASERCTFTVFTPTYNRAGTLPGVYESLCAQTLRDFEWLIVDDGSSDGTAALVEGWQKEAPFPIRFLRQDNLGKHIAFNRAVACARGELFLNLDSDDRCIPQALARFKSHWDSIPPDRRAGFSAVTGLCADSQGRIVGERFPRDVLDSDSIEIRYRYHVHGEKWGFQRTDVLRAHPFPEPAKGEQLRFLPEGIVWSAIARRYRTRFVNEVLRIYDPAPDSLIRGSSPASNALGSRLYHLNVLNHEIAWLRAAPLQFCRSAGQYARCSLHLGIGPRKQIRSLENAPARLLYLSVLPLAWLLYRLDRHQRA